MNARITRFLFGATIALATVLLLFVLPVPVRMVSSAPAVLNFKVSVNTTTDEYNTSGTGTGCSLREAIKSQNDFVNFGGCSLTTTTGPEAILLPSGTYTLTLAGAGEDLDATGDLDIRQSVTISATGVTSPTVTGSTLWNDRIFHILTGTVSIKGIAISGQRSGYINGPGGGAVLIESGAFLTLSDSKVEDSHSSAFSGGGIRNDGTLMLTNVAVINNTAWMAGGIFNDGIATLTNVTLSGNSSSDHYFGGGGFHNVGTATLTNVTLNGNSATSTGAGIYNGGTLTLTTVTLSNNLAFDNGGGIYNDTNGALTLNNVTLSGNSAGHTLANPHSGGGIANAGAASLTTVTLNGNSAWYGGGISNTNTLTLTSVTLSGNSAVIGGGIFAEAGTTSLTNVTLSGNSASVGGGIYFFAGRVWITNTIVANGPSGGNCNESLGGSFNLSSDGTCGFGAGRDNINVMLGPLANNGGSTLTHLPLPGSPAIDFGTNTGCPSTDQRGKPRPQPSSGVCDVGAVEVNVAHVFLPLVMK